MAPIEYTFTRYLSAKKSVDDRALNSHVWQTLVAALPDGPLRVLEIGSGIGTMAERLVERGVLTGGTYTAVDAEPANTAAARARLQALPAAVELELVTDDAFSFATLEQGRRAWDALIAHAFLDLVDVTQALPRLLALLRPGGLCYFTINFDGATILEPAIDPALDAQIEALYHQTMDERITNGRPSGDSRTGRHMFGHLRRAGVDVLAAGSSDWVVFAAAGGYPEDEAYFLHFIIHTLHQALAGHPALDGRLFEAWIAQRHAQIEAGTLVYVAHQLDFVGVKPAA
jgi:SAM-dependent methyltransferase